MYFYGKNEQSVLQMKKSAHICSNVFDFVAMPLGVFRHNAWSVSPKRFECFA